MGRIVEAFRDQRHELARDLAADPEPARAVQAIGAFLDRFATRLLRERIVGPGSKTVLSRLFAACKRMAALLVAVKPASRGAELSVAKILDAFGAKSRRRGGAGGRPGLGMEPPVILAVLEDCLIELEKALGECVRARSECEERLIISNWRILTLCQNLMEAARTNNGGLALQHAAKIPGLLAENGIAIVPYDGKNGDFFEFEPAAGEAPLTIRPALVAGGKLLKRGLAAAPEPPR